MVAVQYSKRDNAFEKTEQVWMVDDEGLSWRRADGVRLGMAWPRVAEIRLTYAPTEWKSWRRKLTLVSPTAGTWTIDNAHFKGIGDFEDRSANFDPFVLACVEKVAAANPAARARLGAGVLAYWAQLGFVGAAFASLAAIVVVLPVEFSGAHWVKLGLIAAMLPTGIAFAVKSWPRAAPLSVEAFRAEIEN